MYMKKVFFVYNPNSGNGRVKASLSDLIQYFSSLNVDVVVYPTRMPRDATRRLRDLGNDYSLIIVAGGDGLLHEAINGLIPARVETPVLYLPSGTTNDFANTHKIPFDLLEAATLVEDGKREILDVGKFGNEYFSYVAAFGVATHVSYATPQEDKKRLGRLAYINTALTTVDFIHWENNSAQMKVRWEDGEFEGDFLYGSISNSRYIAGSDSFVEDLYDWKDGKMEGFFIRRPMNIVELNAIIASIQKRDYENEFFIRVQSAWFEIESTPTAWTLDGEYGGTVDHIRLEVVPQALHVIVPEDEEGEKSV